MSNISKLLVEQFDYFEMIPKPQTSNLVHLYADYVELTALVKNQEIFTVADFIHRLSSNDVKLVDLDQENNDDSSAAESDHVARSAQTVFSILKNRKELYAESYPFQVSSNSINLLETTSIQGKRKIYLTLLMCANLNYFNKLQPTLTADFEQVSYEALKNFMSEDSCVRQFGKNSDYQGTAQEKILSLAADMMNIDLVGKEFNKIRGTQERGLDIVGWYPFADQYSNFLSIFGQCSCGKNWCGKLNETRRFENYFLFEKLNPIHALFVPFAMFSSALVSEGDLFQSDELNNVLFFERLRILENIEGTEFFDSLDSNTIVSFVVAYEEDIV